MFGKAAAAFAAIALFFMASANAYEYSYGYQINRAHTGHIIFSAGFKPPLARKWVRYLGSTVSYPIIANGLVFVTTGYARGPTCKGDSKLYALDLESGATVWSRTVPGNYCISQATYDAGKVFVVNSDGMTRAFTADRTGKLLWKVQLSEYATGGPPTAYGGQLFVVVAGAGTLLYALNENTGALNWQGDVEGTNSSPTIGDGGVFVSFPCQVYKFAQKGGALIWRYNDGCEGGGGTIPVYSAGRVYPGDPASNNAVLDSDDGAVVGRLGADQPPAFWTNSSGQLFDFRLIDHTLGCYSHATGKRVWSFRGDGNLVTPPIVVNDIVAVASSDSYPRKSQLYLLNASTGEQQWSTLLAGPVYQDWGLVTGLGAGLDTLIVPRGASISAYVQKSP